MIWNFFSFGINIATNSSNNNKPKKKKATTMKKEKKEEKKEKKKTHSSNSISQAARKGHARLACVEINITRTVQYLLLQQYMRRQWAA